ETYCPHATAVPKLDPLRPGIGAPSRETIVRAPESAKASTASSAVNEIDAPVKVALQTTRSSSLQSGSHGNEPALAPAPISGRTSRVVMTTSSRDGSSAPLRTSAWYVPDASVPATRNANRPDLDTATYPKLPGPVTGPSSPCKVCPERNTR